MRPRDPGIEKARRWCRRAFRLRYSSLRTRAGHFETDACLGKPGHGDDGPEIYIDLPETVAAWLAVRTFDALDKPHKVNEVVAEEGYCPSGMTLEAARRTIAEKYAKPRTISEEINSIVDDRPRHTG